MHHAMAASLGNLIVAIVAGAITLACFAAMLWMLIHPGERDSQHPKYRVLRNDH